MKVLGWFPSYPPVQNAGAEVATHAVMRWLAARGHEVVVGCPKPKACRPGLIEGVEVRSGPALARRELFSWADIVITHLEVTDEAVLWARTTDTPLAHYLHLHFQLRVSQVPADAAQLVIANSRWVADTVHLDCPVTILHPPVEVERYTVPEDLRVRKHITLVNLLANKGAHLFWKVARSEPQRLFLGVRGSYGKQVIPRRPPSNVELLPNDPEMRDRVYARTRIALMPSAYESWGRVAVEAMCSGIPVLAHPAPGLVESLGDAAVFVDRHDLAGYRRALADLDDAECYQAATARSRQRANVLAKRVQLQLVELEQALVEAAGSWSAVPEVARRRINDLVQIESPYGDRALTDAVTFERRLAGLGWSALPAVDAMTDRILRTGMVATTTSGEVVETTAECFRDWFRPRGWQAVESRTAHTRAARDARPTDR
jgi:glycosyltransferase involved in cell wall biosynthesis